MRRKAAYFKGVRLWQNAQSFPPPQTSGNAGRVTGVTRQFGRLQDEGSPNFFLDLEVPCSIRPPQNVHADMDDQDAHNIELHECVGNLIFQSMPALPLGDLSWCPDDTHTADVLNGPYPPGQDVAVGITAPGWTPVTGRLVLLRDPTQNGGDGFCAKIKATDGASVISVDTPREVGVGWEVIDVTMFYPSCKYERQAFSAPNIGGGDRHRTGTGATYSFTGAAYPVIPDDFVRDIS
jgi:hypothetical protein